ncbi:hypothetical protein [Bdellovibrio bacteriovorus]|uniref:hypothetical protein n=1 Tax=Bdellovibrio bacteriovorus TaxID=959 RepID=UPI0035A656C2
MKTLIALLMMVGTVHQAQALESYYGKATRSGSSLWTCSLHNHTDSTLDMKYVVFEFERTGAHGNTFTKQVRIDERVRSGESLSSTVREFHVQQVSHCKFLAR